MAIVSKILTGMIHFYQGAISPYLGNNCRYTPSCSQYTIEAIKEWGPGRGTLMGLKRFSRCHPWGSSGYDPVPDNPKKENKNLKKH